MKGQTAIETQKGPSGSILKKVTNLLTEHRAVALLVIIVIYAAVFIALFPITFGAYSNFQNVLLNMSGEAFIVIAMTLILISGEIDLSLGSNMVLAGIICGYIIKFGGGSVIVAVGVALAASLAMGLLNGLIIARVGVNSLITTLATGLIFQGIAVWLAGPGLTDFPRYFQYFGEHQDPVFGFRLPVWYSVIAVVLFSYFMTSTRYFRQYYYIGGNVKAAVLSGINIKKMKIVGFVIASLLASIAGIIAAARFNTAMTSVGGGVELRAVTAAVIGGVSFTGGVGTMIGAAVGALFIAFLNNGLIIAGVDPYMQGVFTGAVLILAIVIDILFAKKKAL